MTSKNFDLIAGSIENLIGYDKDGIIFTAYDTIGKMMNGEIVKYCKPAIANGNLYMIFHDSKSNYPKNHYQPISFIMYGIWMLLVA